MCSSTRALHSYRNLFRYEETLVSEVDLNVKIPIILMLGSTVQEINKNIYLKLGFKTEELNIIKKFDSFFYEEKNNKILVDFLKNDNKISLRVIDYFLTNYCLNNKVIIEGTNVYHSYKTQLNNFHKKFFDPCSRGDRIPFFYNKEKCVLTTICQLNFFKWFIEKNIYKYVLKNYQNIKKSMKTNKKTVSNKTDLTFNDDVVYCYSSKPITVSFD